MVRKHASDQVRRIACFRIQSFGICRAADPYRRATSLSWFLGACLHLRMGSYASACKDPISKSWKAMSYMQV